ncbi:uncharacterized protein LOC112177866 [Rosa chinensis]|uniref:uncharacterized protein LOC112177866 n=1 Tax=Rosa chinensis TaxID=74649 RepID=UPI000D08ECB8|nr:uncharacterized protein LOC112177866 [Rosa chinensis]
MVQEWLMLKTTSEFDLAPSEEEQGIFLGSILVQPTLISRIIQGQAQDEFARTELAELATEISDSPSEWAIGSNGGLRLRSRLYVPDCDDLKGKILREAHRSRYTIHLRSTKMYKDLRRQFWWNGMKRDVAEYVSRCLTCQQTDGQTERVNQVMKDTLRACVFDFKGSWEDHLPLEVGDRKLLGPENVQETTEKISIIRDRIRTGQSRQKSYANLKRRQVEFVEGDHVLLNVSPMKGVMRFGKKGTLALRYVGPFEILDRMLRKYIQDESHMIDYGTIEVNADVTFTVEHFRILDRSTKRLRRKEVDLVKVM